MTGVQTCALPIWTGARLALGAIQAVIRGFGIDDAGTARAGRSLRASMHGFCRLENLAIMGRGDHDADFDFLVEMLVDGITQAGSAAHRPGRLAGRPDPQEIG